MANRPIECGGDHSRPIHCHHVIVSPIADGLIEHLILGRHEGGVPVANGLMNISYIAVTPEVSQGPMC